MQNDLKKLAAEKAVEEIHSGMLVGLGTGSTVQFALEKIALKIKNGELENIYCVPSSVRTETEARRFGIPLITFEEIAKRKMKYDEGGNKIINDKLKIKKVNSEKNTSDPLASNLSPLTQNRLPSPVSRFPFIDLTIDGSDEFAVGDPEPTEGAKRIDLIKGGGGALLREKILAQSSRRFVVIIDESKLSDHLGEKWAVPVEVIKFSSSIEEEYLKSLGARVSRRKNSDGTDYITDEGNYIIDANFGIMKDPSMIADILDKRAGIVEHGIFIGLASEGICAFKNGEIRIISSNESLDPPGRTRDK